MKIRLCEHNKGAAELEQRLKGQFPDLNIKLKKCAKQCKICKGKSFVLIDKQPIIMADFDELCRYVVQQNSKNNETIE